MNDRNMLVYQVDGIWNGREAKICYVSDITGKYIEECAKAERESMLYLQAINSSYDMIITLNLTQNLFKLYSNDNFLGYDWSNCKTYEELTAAIAKMIPDSEKVDPRSFLASELTLLLPNTKSMTLREISTGYLSALSIQKIPFRTTFLPFRLLCSLTIRSGNAANGR